MFSPHVLFISLLIFFKAWVSICCDSSLISEQLHQILVQKQHFQTTACDAYFLTDNEDDCLIFAMGNWMEWLFVGLEKGKPSFVISGVSLVQKNFLQCSLSTPPNTAAPSHTARTGFMNGTDQERSSFSFKGHACL